MSAREKHAKKPWIDPDEAPELTLELARRAQISVGGKIVREATGTVTKRRRPTVGDEPKQQDWVSERLNDPENWRPRALVWGEAIASEAFDISEKLVVVAAFGAAAALTQSADVRLAAEVLTLLLAIYITARLDRAFMHIFKARIFTRRIGFALYALAGLGSVWLLAGFVLPKLTAAIEGLVVAALN